MGIFEAESIVSLTKHISKKSVEKYYNPYTAFKWVDHIENNNLWVDKELLSVYNTSYYENLSKSDLINISKWESINFYSLNVHGIRELLVEMVNRIHNPRYKSISSFLHHFIGEENDHMWFFSEFCNRYGRIYPNKITESSKNNNLDIEDLLIFSRIVIFEEIVDYYNSIVGSNNKVHPLIRDINYYHHIDESRHVSFGRGVIKELYSTIEKDLSKEELKNIRNYLIKYMKASLEKLYNASVYKDAGIKEPYQFKRDIMNDPGRTEMHLKMMKRTLNYFISIGALQEEDRSLVCTLSSEI